MFKQHGYHTQSIGKFFHGSGPPSPDPPSWSADPSYDTNRAPNVRYALPSNRAGEGLKRSSTEAADVDDDVYLDGLVCSVAETSIEELATTDKPFFLAVGFRKPHLPFCAPKKYWDLYERNQIPLPEFPATQSTLRNWRLEAGKNWKVTPTFQPASNCRNRKSVNCGTATTHVSATWMP